MCDPCCGTDFAAVQIDQFRLVDRFVNAENYIGGYHSVLPERTLCSEANLIQARLKVCLIMGLRVHRLLKLGAFDG